VSHQERDAFLLAEIGDPVSGKHALDAQDESVAQGRQGREKRVRPVGQVAVEEDRTDLVEEADVNPPGVQINPGIKSVLLRGEAHHGAPVKRDNSAWRGNFLHTR
jgi:hypothetical protein